MLAFANLSEDKGNETFSEGVSEELLNVLAKIPDLKVTARTSAFHFKGKDTPIPEIAKQLGVAYVVEGSVRKADNRVRITAQLIKAADGLHVWSDTFTRDLKDIFAVQEEIAGLIAQQLQLKLGMSSRATQVVNPEAHRLVLEGRYFWNLRSEEGFARAETAFKQALVIDPQFAPARAGLALDYVIRGQYRVLDGIAGGLEDWALGRTEALPSLEHTPPLTRRLFFGDALFDPWRDDPRFQQLLVKLNCAAEHQVARETLTRMLKENGRRIVGGTEQRKLPASRW